MEGFDERATVSARALSGLGCMLGAMALIPAGDAIAKHLLATTSHSAGFLAWTRFAVGAVLVVPFAWSAFDARALGPRFLGQQLLRAALIAATIVLIITAVGKSPLPNVFGAFFVGPLVSLVLAVLWLKERAGALEWVSVALGFVGVLLVVRPGGTLDAGLLWALAAGVCYGAFLATTRWAAGHGAPRVQLAAQLVLGGLMLLPFAATDLVAGAVDRPSWLVAMCLCSVTANLLSLMAYARAGAAWLAPVVYVQLLAASALGVIFFDDRIGATTAAGLALILLTGLMRLPLGRRAKDGAARRAASRRQARE